MKNQIAVVSYGGKNYFFIESTRKIKFLVSFIRMRYFASKESSQACMFEAYRNASVILYGFIDFHTQNSPTAMFDYSDVSPLHMDREFQVLSAEPFQMGDIICPAEPGGELIANELHRAIDFMLSAKKAFNEAQKKMPETKMHIESHFKYKKIGTKQILIPGLY